MVFWNEVINVSHLHRLYGEGKINIIQLAKGMVARLKTTSFYVQADRDFMDVITEFDQLNEFSAIEDYRIAFDYLLDFADQNNRLWIETEEPTDKHDIKQDETAVKVNARMIEDYDGPQVYVDISKKLPIVSELINKGPYYRRDVSKAVPASNNSSFTSSSTSSSKYNRRKTVRYLSDYEFDKRLKAKGISPKAMAKDFYNYVRDADDDYQDWVMDRFAENIGGYVEMQPEAIALGE